MMCQLYFFVIQFTLIFSYFDNFQPGEYVLYKNKDYEVEVGPIVRAPPPPNNNCYHLHRIW